jgi:hypothetical protein
MRTNGSTKLCRPSAASTTTCANTPPSQHPHHDSHTLVMAQEALLPVYSKLASYYKWGDHGDEDELCGPMNKWGLETTYVDHPPTHPCGSCMLIWWGGNDRLLEDHDIFKKGLGVLTLPEPGTFMHEMLKLLPPNTNGTSHPRHAHPFHDTPLSCTPLL